jgi:hypothetical protein
MRPSSSAYLVLAVPLCLCRPVSAAAPPPVRRFASLTHQQYQYRQCQDPRTYQRPKDEGRRLQYRIVHVLHPVHSSGSSQQHDTQEAPSFGLDKCDYVLLGCVACRSISRVNSEFIVRCHHYLSRCHPILCGSCRLPRSTRSLRGRLLSR